MRTRLILAAVCILTLPLWFSALPGDRLADPTPFATVALAGHTLAGEWCGCGTPGCLCDPGEVVGQSNRPVSDQTKRPLDQGASPIRARSGFDYGTGALMAALALFVWTRLRA
ncbi:MAG: hypothetical protein AABN33_14040 [Acidobacteriota bacterium]